MYICLCRGITENDVKQACTGPQVKNTQDVLKQLGVGSDCGTCLQSAIEKFMEFQASTPQAAKNK